MYIELMRKVEIYRNLMFHAHAQEVKKRKKKCAATTPRGFVGTQLEMLYLILSIEFFMEM